MQKKQKVNKNFIIRYKCLLKNFKKLNYSIFIKKIKKKIFIKNSKFEFQTKMGLFYKKYIFKILQSKVEINIYSKFVKFTIKIRER